MQDFTKLSVWQKSYKLALEIYRVTRNFPKEELYGITSQMRRPSTSIPANIAEGCGRYTGSELVRFLDIAMGSGSELHYYLMFACDLNYLSDETYVQLEPKVVEVKQMLTAFILKLCRDNKN
jgi:four helix bundle protein